MSMYGVGPAFAQIEPVPDVSAAVHIPRLEIGDPSRHKQVLTLGEPPLMDCAFLPNLKDSYAGFHFP
jgi:hypothetical protein